MSDSVVAHLCRYGVFKITEPTGVDSVPKEDGDDRNSSKMSIILVEGVC
jgi:hypothetical protein